MEKIKYLRIGYNSSILRKLCLRKMKYKIQLTIQGQKL